MWSQDYYKKNTTFANRFEGNVIGVMYQGKRNDFTAAHSGTTLVNNALLQRNPTKADEEAEWVAWQAKTRLHNISLGVR